MLDTIEWEDVGVFKMEVVRSTQPKEGYLEKIRDICSEKNIVLVFDECTSGFREAYGGIHLNFNVEPDMAIFGKALGNGYAITSIIGRGSMMNGMLDTFISSTFWTERIGTRAALATLKEMKKQKSWLKIPKTGKSVKNIWKKYAEKYELDIIVEGIDGLPTFRFLGKNNRALKTGFTERMLEYGILATTQFYPTTKHNSLHLQKYARAVSNVFEELSTILREDKCESLCIGRMCEPSFRRLN